MLSSMWQVLNTQSRVTGDFADIKRSLHASVEVSFEITECSSVENILKNNNI